MTIFQEAVFDCKDGKPRKTGLKYYGFKRQEYFKGWDLESFRHFELKREKKLNRR
jgi:hypothetical protein